jgi:hypothetical protein
MEMSRGSKPRALGEIMKELVSELGHTSRLGEATIIAAWQDISGPRIRQVTERAWLDRGRLVVKVSSAPWRQELHLQRGAWCQRLNDKLGRQAVKEIVFR